MLGQVKPGFGTLCQVSLGYVRLSCYVTLGLVKSC
jgi:hypothetical protein